MSPEKFVAAEYRDQHARCVRYPEDFAGVTRLRIESIRTPPMIPNGAMK